LITIYGGTDIGLVRKTNQDSFTYKVMGELLAYAVLCDGMGGPGSGHVASETATRFVSQTLDHDLKPGMSEASLKNVMISAVAGANALVYDAARQNPNLAGMGTTMIIAVVSGDMAFISYVGDSRVYYFNGCECHQLTKDHTVVQMLLDIGEISLEEAAEHPKRHFITRAVGVSSTVGADFAAHPFNPGDMLFLCSDGFYNYVGCENMAEPALGSHLQKSGQDESVDNLLQLAKDVGGGGDNITAVVIRRGAEQPCHAEKPEVDA